MIKTKTAFIIFALLSIFIFPYYLFLLYINSDFLSSIIPGWNTTIVPIRLISNLIKFLLLIMISFYYWKLSKVIKEINLKKFILHFALTLPLVLIAKLNVYQFVEMKLYNPESFLSQIQMVIYINVFVNILFFLGQILFVIHYKRSKKSLLHSI